jgi:NADH pyrophosphatase NudC (nudix superfamily)
MDESNEIYQIMDLDASNRYQFCPKCGSQAFKSIDLGRSYRCDDCGFHYFVNNSAAVACLIFNESGDLLLTRRAFEPNKGMLDLPGGFVEPLETAEGAVCREILEELNLNILKIEYLTSFPNLYPFSGVFVPTLDLAFLCKVEDFTQLKPGDDVESVEFVNPKHIKMNEICSESMRQIIQFYLHI